MSHFTTTMIVCVQILLLILWCWLWTTQYVMWVFFAFYKYSTQQQRYESFFWCLVSGSHCTHRRHSHGKRDDSSTMPTRPSSFDPFRDTRYLASHTRKHFFYLEFENSLKGITVWSRRSFFHFFILPVSVFRPTHLSLISLPSDYRLSIWYDSFMGWRLIRNRYVFFSFFLFIRALSLDGLFTRQLNNIKWGESCVIATEKWTRVTDRVSSKHTARTSETSLKKCKEWNNKKKTRFWQP